MVRLIFLYSVSLFVFINTLHSQNTTVNGAKKYQVIYGLGVNANPQSWNINPEAVKKVVDALIDSMGCTSFRLMYFYVLKQLYNFVKPGFRRISISTSLPDMTISAFTDTAKGTTVITGINNSNKPQVINCTSLNLPSIRKLHYYYSDKLHNCVQGADIKVVRQAYSKAIPAKCVFTFVSL